MDKSITYCGLCCELCTQKTRTPKLAKILKETMQQDGIEQWGNGIPNFKEFWAFLSNLIENEKKCSCRDNTCGSPFCSIRKCAKEKNIEVCVYCDEFPCSRVESIAKGYPTLIADTMRMKEIGVEKWVAEQKKRKDTGFQYSDIRCYPYNVPE